MFTKNNWVFVSGKKFGDEYQKVSLDNITNKTAPIAIQIPTGESSFVAPISEIEITELDPNEKPTIYRCIFENTLGDQYIVELDPEDVNIFCKYSKFKNLGLYIQWGANFAAMDWKGYPCKMINAEKVSTENIDKLYNIKTKETNNLIISGIVFITKEGFTSMADNSDLMES